MKNFIEGIIVVILSILMIIGYIFLYAMAIAITCLPIVILIGGIYLILNLFI